MPLTRGQAITGVGAAIGAAALAFGVANFGDGLAPLAPASGDRFVCLKTDLGYVEGAGARCYSRAEIEALAGKPVLNDAGAPVTVSLTHPTDHGRAPESVSACDAYKRLSGERWYALSTREIREEAWFVRACGALELLASARAPDVSYFEHGALTAHDLEGLAAAAPFTIGEGGADAPAMAVAKSKEGEWRLSGGGQTAVVQEIAHADFTLDGVGDMLVFVSIGIDEGTATASEIGLLEKRSPDGDVTFSKR